MQLSGSGWYRREETRKICSYEQAASYMRQMHLDAGDIEQLYRRMVFNVLAVNRDDHVKNISFLMNKQGKWKLAPAYDLTFAYEPRNRWLSAHQMLIQGKNKDITVDDLLASGRSMDISTKRCKKIIHDVQQAVSSWKEIADEVGIREKTAIQIDEILKANNIKGEDT